MLERIETEFSKYLKNVRKSTWNKSFIHLVSLLIIALISFLAWNVVSQFLGAVEEQEFSLFTKLAIISNVVLYLWLIGIFLQFQYGFVWKRMKDNSEYSRRVEKLGKVLTNVFKNDKAGLTELQNEVNAEFGTAKKPWLVEYFVTMIRSSQELIPTRLIAVYEIYRAQEEDQYNDFTEEGKRFLVQFVRIGILGTFLGLLTSFLLTANVLELLQKSFEARRFLQNLQISLSGYAFAVLSSVLANFISIIYEIAIVKRLKKVHLLAIVEVLYKGVLSGQLGGGSIAKVDKDIYQTIGDELVEIRDIMNRLRVSLTDDMKKLTEEISTAFAAPKAFSRDLKTVLDDTMAHLKNILECMEKETRSLGGITQVFVKDLHGIRQDATDKIRKVTDDFVGNLETMRSSSNSDLQNLNSSIIKRLEKLQKDVHADIDHLDGKNKEFVKSIDAILKDVVNDLRSNTQTIKGTLAEAVKAVDQLLSTIRVETKSIPTQSALVGKSFDDMVAIIGGIKETAEDIQIQLNDLNFPDAINSWAGFTAEINSSMTSIIKTIDEVKHLNSALAEGKEDRIVKLIPRMRDETVAMLKALQSFREHIGNIGVNK